MNGIKCDILLAGVGGQGTVLASRVLARASMNKGLPVRTNETIGMAQRGGSVTGHVRINPDSLSPMIPLGRADALIGFEPAEAVRNLPYLREGGRAVVSTDGVRPVTASLDPSAYDVKSVLRGIACVPGCVLVGVSELCSALGSAKCANMVLLGAALRAGALPFTREEIITAMRSCLPEKLWSLNERAIG